VTMAVFRISEIAGEAVFQVQAGDAAQARRLVKLNCEVPAGDPAQYSCEIDANAPVPYGVIYSPVTGKAITVTKR
jgi:hypothetical protein